MLKAGMVLGLVSKLETTRGKVFCVFMYSSGFPVLYLCGVGPARRCPSLRTCAVLGPFFGNASLKRVGVLSVSL